MPRNPSVSNEVARTGDANKNCVLDKEMERSNAEQEPLFQGAHTGNTGVSEIF